MSTFAKFFGCDATGEISRTLDDTQPIAFDWGEPTAVSIDAEVAFDNINYEDAVGEVVELSEGRWQLNYDAQDRPTNPGLVTYKFTDNLGNTDYLSVNFTGTPAEPDLPDIKYPSYGPRRVKTKEMDIEQFDPMKLAFLDDRSQESTPTFGSHKFAVGVPLPEHKHEKYEE